MPPAAAREEQDMETITNLIKDTPIPKMVKVRQNFDKTCIPESDIPGIITRELDRPEIGGKIQRALDKTNDYDFVYRNTLRRRIFA